MLSLLVDWFQHRSGDEPVFSKWPLPWQVLLITLIPLAALVIHQLQIAPPVFVYP